MLLESVHTHEILHSAKHQSVYTRFDYSFVLLHCTPPVGSLWTVSITFRSNMADLSKSLLFHTSIAISFALKFTVYKCSIFGRCPQHFTTETHIMIVTFDSSNNALVRLCCY